MTLKMDYSRVEYWKFTAAGRFTFIRLAGRLAGPLEASSGKSVRGFVWLRMKS